MKKSGRSKEGTIPTIFDFGEYDLKASDIPTTSKQSSSKQQKDTERIGRLVQRPLNTVKHVKGILATS